MENRINGNVEGLKKDIKTSFGGLVIPPEILYSKKALINFINQFDALDRATTTKVVNRYILENNITWRCRA